jgi:hypothetical protein
MALPWYAIHAGPRGAGVTGFRGDFVYVWSPSGQLLDWPAYTGTLIIGTASPSYPYTTYPTWYLNHPSFSPYVVAFRIPVDAVTGGTYYVSWIIGLESYYIEVTVVDESRHPYLIRPASTFHDIHHAQSYIQDAINAGYSPIYLSPGDYPITRPFDLTGPYVAPVVVIDGQNWASLTARPELGVFGNDPIHGYMFSVTKPLTLKRLIRTCLDG